MTFRSKQTLWVVGTLAFCLLLTFLLIFTRKAPHKKPASSVGPLVEVQAVNPLEIAVMVSGQGTVQSKTQVSIVPQVGGQVISVSKSMASGAHFRARQTLFKIDPTDYRVAFERSKAEVSQAEVALKKEEALAAIVREEWKLEHPGGEKAPSLAAHQLQLDQAKAALRAAKAGEDQAKANLRRTRISLPFAGRVITESVALGQIVGPGQSVGTAYGEKSLEIPIPLADREMAFLSLGASPSPAKIWATYQGVKREWKGHLARLDGAIDPQTRLSGAVVAVDESLSLEKKIPLPPGLFVSVEIGGKTLSNVYSLSPSFLRENETVWVEKNGVLHIQPVTVVRQEENRVLVSSGLQPGDRVILTALDVVVEGMSVRVEGTPAPSNETRANETQADEIRAPVENQVDQKK